MKEKNNDTNKDIQENKRSIRSCYGGFVCFLATNSFTVSSILYHQLNHEYNCSD